MDSAFEYYIKIIGDLTYMVDRISLLEVSKLYLLGDIAEQLKVVGELEEEGLLLEQKHEFIDCLEGPYLDVGDFL